MKNYEALKALEEGKKVMHKSFVHSSYLYKHGDEILFNNNNLSASDDLISDSDGWELYEPNQPKKRLLTDSELFYKGISFVRYDDKEFSVIFDEGQILLFNSCTNKFSVMTENEKKESEWCTATDRTTWHSFYIED